MFIYVKKLAGSVKPNLWIIRLRLQMTTYILCRCVKHVDIISVFLNKLQNKVDHFIKTGWVMVGRYWKFKQNYHDTMQISFILSHNFSCLSL